MPVEGNSGARDKLRCDPRHVDHGSRTGRRGNAFVAPSMRDRKLAPLPTRCHNVASSTPSIRAISPNPASMTRSCSDGRAVRSAARIDETLRSNSIATSSASRARLCARAFANTSASTPMRTTKSSGQSRARRRQAMAIAPSTRPATLIGVPRIDRTPFCCQVALSTCASGGRSLTCGTTTARPARMRWIAQGKSWVIRFGGTEAKTPSTAQEWLNSTESAAKRMS